ncbi:lariat debranching enzyme [Thecaphora frezii]
MKVAVEGCSHGELDAIYASLLRAEREQGFAVDLLLLCGDFQAIRNHADLHCLAVPPKYRKLGGFHRYYSGEKLAPVLTLVIGGNHEASNYMWELYHGGWLAPNIYYLGAAGAVEVGGLTIAGISGIYKAPDYHKGRFERLPYDASTIRSTYHTRSYDIHRLKLLGSADVVLSHDWPNTIEQHGDTPKLIRKKPFFAEEIRTETLGSPPLWELMRTLEPPYWFSAHLHVKFAALYDHTSQASSQGPTAAAPSIAQPQEPNPEMIAIDLDDGLDEGELEAAPEAATVGESIVDEEPVGAGCQHSTATAAAPDVDLDGCGDAVANEPPATSSGPSKLTRFLALSKCLPQGDFLQYLDIASREDASLSERKTIAAAAQQRAMPTFRYSRRWLAITRALHPELSLGVRQPPLPPIDDPVLLQRIQNEEAWINEHLLAAATTEGEASTEGQDDLAAPREHPLDIHRVQRFVRTAPAPFEPGGLVLSQPSWYTNPQTEAFCNMLGIENKINPRPAHLPPPFVPGGPWPPANLPPPFIPGHGPGPGPMPAVFPGGAPPPTGAELGGMPDATRKRAWDHDQPTSAPSGPVIDDPNALDIGEEDFEVDETADPPPFAIEESAKRWAEGTG